MSSAIDATRQHRLHYRQHSMQHVNIALFAMPPFWAHHQHHTTLPRRAHCQLLLLTLLICLQKQHHRLVGNRIRLHTSPTFNAACTLPSLPCQFLGSPSASHHPSSSCTVRSSCCCPSFLICLQHHRLAGNRIRAPAAEQANTNVLLPTIIHVWPQMSLSTLKRLPQGAMTQEASHREP